MNSEIGDKPGDEMPVVLTPISERPRAGLRVRHMLLAVAVFAVLIRTAIGTGLWFIVVVLVLFFATGVGLILISFRRSQTQRQSLLWALAVASERSLPLADAALAFAEQFGRSYRWRVQLFASLLNEGVPLPDALGRAPGVVSREAEVLVRTGYSSGTLARSLREAAALRSSRESAWGTTAARFVYLGSVLMTMQALVGFMLYFMIPKFEAIFKDFGISLPRVTRITIEMSHFVIQYFFVTGPILFLVEVIIPLFLVVGLLNSYALWWNVPLIDYVVRRRHSALLMRALGMAVEGKKPIASAIGSLAVDYPSSWVRGRLRRVVDDVRQGRDWVESLLDHSLIRPAEAAVLVAAQRVGNLEWALREMAESSDRRLGYRLKFWLQMLFPLLILGLGAVVFLFAVAYFSPLVRLIEALAG